MSNILEIAESLKTYIESYMQSLADSDLNVFVPTLENGVEVLLAPEFDLRKMQTARIVVAPFGKNRKFVSRGSFDNNSVLDVVVIHKCESDANAREFIVFAETLGNSFLGARFSSVICTGLKWEPLFSAEDLRAKRIFISVMQLSFKEFAG